MSIPSPDLAEVLATVRSFVLAALPGEVPEAITIHLVSGRKAKLPIPMAGLTAAARPPQPEPFVPSPFQEAILDALEGKALRTDALGSAVGDRSRLYKPGGLKELREQGLVAHHERLGFYRPDAPPPQLEE